MARELHRKAHEVCPNGAANWADCDRVADDRYADWQAMQQVLFAYKLLTRDRADHKTAQMVKRLKKDGVFGALMRWLDGDTDDLMNDDGNPNEGPWPKRLRAAVQRALAGDYPNYNLYGIKPRGRSPS